MLKDCMFCCNTFQYQTSNIEITTSKKNPIIKNLNDIKVTLIFKKLLLSNIFLVILVILLQKFTFMMELEFSYTMLQVDIFTFTCLSLFIWLICWLFHMQQLIGVLIILSANLHFFHYLKFNAQFAPSSQIATPKQEYLLNFIYLFILTILAGYFSVFSDSYNQTVIIIYAILFLISFIVHIINKSSILSIYMNILVAMRYLHTALILMIFLYILVCYHGKKYPIYNKIFLALLFSLSCLLLCKFKLIPILYIKVSLLEHNNFVRLLFNLVISIILSGMFMVLSKFRIDLFLILTSLYMCFLYDPQFTTAKFFDKKLNHKYLFNLFNHVLRIFILILIINFHFINTRIVSNFMTQKILMIFAGILVLSLVILSLNTVIYAQFVHVLFYIIIVSILGANMHLTTNLI